jgi:hypothetical protein
VCERREDKGTEKEGESGIWGCVQSGILKHEVVWSSLSRPEQPHDQHRTRERGEHFVKPESAQARIRFPVI